MATITRVQHFQNDSVSLLAVQGLGTDKFQASGQPKTPKANFGAVFSGNLRITKSATSGGYFFLLTDARRGTDRKRVFFRGSAEVRIGGEVVTVDAYYNMLTTVERFSALFG